MATKKEWLEGHTRAVDLPDDEPPVFLVWLNWIYRQHLAVGLNTGERMATPFMVTAWSLLINAYALGDKLLDGDFKDAVIDAMAALEHQTCDGRKYVPGVCARTFLYHMTTPGSTARKFLIHIMARAKNLLTEQDDHSLLLDIAKLNVDANAEDTINDAAGCEFHEHKIGQINCYRTKYVMEELVFSDD